MARLVDRLTPLAVSKQKKPGHYADGNGLWLQVSKSGSKSWVLRFTIAGKQREMGLGPVHTVTLAEARERAREYRKQRLEGQDPIDARKASRLSESLERARAMTFDDCAAAYIAAHRSSWKNAKHASQWENTLQTYASPIIGKLPVADVDTALVVKVLGPIWGTKTETATRLRGRIESILGWATVSNLRKGDNPARWRGHLDNLLADPSRSKRTVHHPALPWQEAGAFMANLRKQAGIAAKATELAILTACRSGEIRLATWAEFDLDARLWVIPAERMKAEREHWVPLSTAALTLLESLPRMGELVFPGVRDSRPLSDMSLTAVLRRMNASSRWLDAKTGKPIVVHGFRSTFRDWAGESTSYARETIEHSLAHNLPDKTEASYARGTQTDKRSKLMQAWADYCDTVPVVANVTPIRGAKTA